MARPPGSGVGGWGRASRAPRPPGVPAGSFWGEPQFRSHPPVSPSRRAVPRLGSEVRRRQRHIHGLEGTRSAGPGCKTKVPAGPLERSHPERVLPCVPLRAAQAASLGGFQKKGGRDWPSRPRTGPFACREGPPPLVSLLGPRLTPRWSPGARESFRNPIRWDTAPTLVLAGQGATHGCAKHLKSTYPRPC